MIYKWKKKIKNHFKDIIKTKPSPHAIALGFAVGTFISILPTPGLNFVLGIIILLIFKRINKYSLFVALIFWNTLTLTPIYFLSYLIGDFIFGPAPIVTIKLSFLHKVSQFSRRFLLGNFILSIPLSLISYYVVRFITQKIYKKSKSRK